jgi:competence protein ComEC
LDDQALAIVTTVTALLMTSTVILLVARRLTFLMFLNTCLLWVAAGTVKGILDSTEESDIPHHLLEREAVMVGKLVEAPHTSERKCRFLVQGRALYDGKERYSFATPVLVSMVMGSGMRLPSYGMTVMMKGSLLRPPPDRNPGEFNQRIYYESNGISWLFFVGRNGLEILDSAGGYWLMRHIVVPARLFTVSAVNELVGGQEGELLKGVMIGERAGLSTDVRDAFTVAGVSHILAVSGGNVAIIAAFVFFALEILRVPGKARVIVAVSGVLFYMLLVGNQPPVVRAAIMAIVLLGGRLFEEPPNPVNALGVAGLVILLIDARQLFDVGFQLSFLAVLSIVFLYPVVNSWIGLLRGDALWVRTAVPVLRICAVSFVATLGTLPLTASYFGRVSLIGVLSNIAVVPASGVSLVLGFVTVILFPLGHLPADAYAALNRLILELTIDLTVFAASIPYASIDTLRFTSIDALPYYTLLMAMVHRGKAETTRKLIIVFLASLVLRAFVPPPPGYSGNRGTLCVTFVDVGQGDAALVELPDGKTLLIDAGPLTAAFDAGERVLVPFLKRRGISTLDQLLVSHPHSDHFGGVSAILGEFEVLRVLHSGRRVESALFREYEQAIRLEQCPVCEVRNGDRVEVSPDVRVYVLSPPAGSPSMDRGEVLQGVNNASVVVKIVYRDIAFLFTGDAEEEAELLMTAAYGDFLKADLVKAGHHGSRTSSTEEFLAAVGARYAVISVGRFNRYSHPSSSTIRRFNDHGTRVFRTDEDGALMFESDGVRLWKVEWRTD